jgi:uncharacterized protein DUF4288
MPVTGLENFMLTLASFRRLFNRRVQACVNLRTYEVTPVVKRLPPSKRLPYMAVRVDRWIQGLYRLHRDLSFQLKNGDVSGRRVRRWSQLPSTLTVHGPAREVCELSKAPGVRSIHVTRIAGRRSRQSPKSPLAWYCVRAVVIIRVERAKLGNQNIEDRFVLVRASSFEDAKKRLKQLWREYATPYLNSDGQMVSWSLDKVIDVYDTGETEIDPGGTEVYSKLRQRRMRPQYVWRPKSTRAD